MAAAKKITPVEVQAKRSFARPAATPASKAVAQRITAWSYSRYNDYKQCPLKAKFKHVDKLKEPGSPAMDRGSAIHKLAENFLKGLVRALPAELKTFGAFFRALKKLNPAVEQDWAFTANWVQCGWFDVVAWCRVKVDATAYDTVTKRVRVVDHKTGRFNPDHPDQLSLYAVAAFEVFPDADAADCELWYLDHPLCVGGPLENPVRKTFQRAEAQALKKDWEKRVKPMLADTRFAPRPNDRCRWCWFRKDNGQYPGGVGPCKF